VRGDRRVAALLAHTHSFALDHRITRDRGVGLLGCVVGSVGGVGSNDVPSVVSQQ
jgi:hypothetical protein